MANDRVVLEGLEGLEGLERNPCRKLLTAAYIMTPPTAPMAYRGQGVETLSGPVPVPVVGVPALHGKPDQAHAQRERHGGVEQRQRAS